MASDAPIEFRRVRDFGEVLNATFAFLQQNALGLGKSLLFIAGPFVAVMLLSFGLLPFNIFLFGLQPNFDPTTFDFGVLGLPILLIVVFALLAGAIPYLVVNAYLILYQDYGPGGFDPVRDVWSVVRGDFFMVFATMLFLIGILILPVFIVAVPCLGALVYMGGVFYVGVTCSQIFIMRMREENGLIAAFQRCFYLIKDHWWETFGIVFLSSILAAILGSVFSLPAYIVAFASGLGGGDETAGTMVLVIIVFSVVGTFVSVLLQAIPLTAIAFQYFSLVEQKEQVGLSDRIDRIDPDAPFAE